MSWSGFFYPDPDPSLSIFSICRYRVPMWYLALTNFTWIIQLHLETKYLHPSCSLVGFFILLKQSIYFHMALPYSAYAIATLAYHIPCVSRWVCDAVLVCSHLKCVRRTHAWYLHIIAFNKFLTLSHKITWTHCLSISHTFSISSIASFTCSAVWDPGN